MDHLLVKLIICCFQRLFVNVTRFCFVRLQSPPSPASNMALDIFGPEMADLQELLVSMASGKNIQQLMS
jgi:hypothetical protein